MVLIFLGLLAWGALGKFPMWLRGALAGVGVIGAGVFIAASFGTQLTTPPKAFLVPGGLILAVIGLLYLAVSLGVCSDSQFVTLTRRELSAYFFSPIGYLVLAGMALAEGLAYRDFVNRLAILSAGGRGAVPEPIVQHYFISLLPVLAMTILVPMLTMRLVAEERRTGSIEVMFTTAVPEWVVVLSKFLATWFVFCLCWVPMGLYLVVLRVEGGSPFDYRPLLGSSIALGITGASFVAMGLFFSALTKNQIIAGVLTFVPMLGFLICYFVGDSRSNDLGQTLQFVMKKLSYIDMWTESLSGQMPVRDLMLWASLTIFWLFLCVKVFETRRWS
jgi:ABC-2 type transport system permease protein